MPRTNRYVPSPSADQKRLNLNHVGEVHVAVPIQIGQITVSLDGNTRTTNALHDGQVVGKIHVPIVIEVAGEERLRICAGAPGQPGATRGPTATPS